MGFLSAITQPLLLINSNVSRPPVSPVGLEYTGYAAISAGIPVEVLDLAFEPDWKGALRMALGRSDPLAVGICLRNTDDCSLASSRSFLPWVSELVKEARQLSGAPLILGGVGFSVFPAGVVELTGADFGINGDSEETVPLLLKRLSSQEKYYADIPNLVYRQGGRILQRPRTPVDVSTLPFFERSLLDNPRYQREGAMVGIETKRGCNQGCVYCADPVAKGKRIRLRPPQAVVEEIKSLLRQGVSWFHLCDSEFNLPLRHAKELCRELIRSGLENKSQWYCYCSPFPFDRELAYLMKRAGCAGINFGVDSLDDGQLSRYGRLHRLEHIEALISLLRENGMNFILDLLIGGPGEDEGTVRHTIEQVERLSVPLAGMAVGVRVYPQTTMGRRFEAGLLEGGLHPPGARSLLEPVFYVSPSLGQDPWELVHHLVGSDSRFLLLAKPSQEGSYNYAGDNALSKAIEEGARGAYWDILGKNRR